MSDLSDVTMQELKVQTEVKEVNKVDKVIVVFVVIELLFEQTQSKVKDPEGPHICSVAHTLRCNIRAKNQRYCVSKLSSCPSNCILN